MKKEEREKFIGSFAQAKNLIEKQMKLGNMIKDHKHQVNINRQKVMKVKREKEQENHVVALKNKPYVCDALDQTTNMSSFNGEEIPEPIMQRRLNQSAKPLMVKR
jgi:hypothetical protein